MAMVVDETKLNAAMTATADVIREKLGSEEQIPFDYNGGTGFADAVEAIPQGGCGATVTIKPLAANRPELSSTSFEGVDTLIIDGTKYSNWSGSFTADGMRKLVVIDPSNRANRSGCFRTSDSASKTIEEIEFIGSTSNATNMSTMFRENRNLKRIIGELDFSSITTSGNVSQVFMNCNNLEEVRFTPNSLKVSITMNYVGAMFSNDTIISIANMLNASASGQTLSASLRFYSKFAAIMGDVTDGLFVENASGTMTLSNFVTSVKGWNLTRTD